MAVRDWSEIKAPGRWNILRSVIRGVSKLHTESACPCPVSLAQSFRYLLTQSPFGFDYRHPAR